ncbi:GMC oxidoreductase [Paracoccus alkenifer]|uniref:Choline dehydrogenase n=1 Tax=Paracoccus alkenifer TaxID=65735 RepID=A0A1H6MZI1_9RHOB|nr:GMC family oxidoreductase [Paracoccus alkenifer]SEI05270.1 Choline dehydrogenase [Paracoccus alkenifer]
MSWRPGFSPDVVVIGAGMGGGLTGRALAEAGLSVLFLERGPTPPRRAVNPLATELTDPYARELLGCWPVPTRAHVGGVPSLPPPTQGVGPGGTSAFYAGAMERPARRDLETVAAMAHPTGGWPVGYDEFAPWFDRAQEMLHLNGTADPLGDAGAPPLPAPPPLSPAHEAHAARLRGRGLHPYRTPLAIRHLPGCRECIGHRCPMPCKMDGRSAGVEPALATGRAEMWDRAVVRRLLGQGRRVEGVEVEIDGRLRVIRAPVVVLAAGALSSPRLLLASASESWPQGCANASGLVGRGLMFHLNELFALWPPRGLSRLGPRKVFSLRDFYDGDAARPERWGLVQGLGVTAEYGFILAALRARLESSVLRRVPGLRAAMGLPAALAARLLGSADLYAAMVEDLPVDDNRVGLDPDNPDDLVFWYDLPPELLARRRRLRRQLSRRFGRGRILFLNHKPEINYSHACGTLRFSDDPARGVLDRDCRAHDLDNLYVTDASFMPTATGVNPSLTIAANALRVASVIAARHAVGHEAAR